MSEVEELRAEVVSLRVEISAALDALAGKLDSSLDLLAGVAVKRKSVAQLAREQGVHRSTITRRRQAARHKLLAAGKGGLR